MLSRSGFSPSGLGSERNQRSAGANTSVFSLFSSPATSSVRMRRACSSVGFSPGLSCRSGLPFHTFFEFKISAILSALVHGFFSLREKCKQKCHLAHAIVVSEMSVSESGGCRHISCPIQARMFSCFSMPSDTLSSALSLGP